MLWVYFAVMVSRAFLFSRFVVVVVVVELIVIFL